MLSGLFRGQGRGQQRNRGAAGEQRRGTLLRGFGGRYPDRLRGHGRSICDHLRSTSSTCTPPARLDATLHPRASAHLNLYPRISLHSRGRQVG